MSKETTSPKSMMGARKRTKQGQGGESSMCNSTRTASWQAQHKDLIRVYGRWRRKAAGRGSSRCNGLRVQMHMSL